MAGRVKISQLTPAGKEVILRVDGPGALIDCVGSVSAIYTSTARAVDPCRVLTWEVSVFGALTRRYPVIPRNAIDVMSRRLQALGARFCDVSTERVPQRLARLLIHLVEQSAASGHSKPVGLSREELAQMTGTTLFTVSRLLREWAEQDIVQVDRKLVVVEQPSRLLQLAEDATGLQPVRPAHSAESLDFAGN